MCSLFHISYFKRALFLSSWAIVNCQISHISVFKKLVKQLCCAFVGGLPSTELNRLRITWCDKLEALPRHMQSLQQLNRGGLASIYGIASQLRQMMVCFPATLSHFIFMIWRFGSHRWSGGKGDWTDSHLYNDCQSESGTRLWIYDEIWLYSLAYNQFRFLFVKISRGWCIFGFIFVRR